MQEIGQAVDHRNGAVPSKRLGLGVVKRPDHDAIHVSREDARRVAKAFRVLAAAEVRLGGGEHDRMPAQVEHPDLEGDPGSSGVLPEDHAERLARERELPAPVAPRLQTARPLEELGELPAGEVSQREKVAGPARVRRHSIGARTRGGTSEDVLPEILVPGDRSETSAHEFPVHDQICCFGAVG